MDEERAAPGSALIALISEERFQSVGGDLYSPNRFGDEFWQRYIDVFGSIVVVARVGTCLRPAHGSAILAHEKVAVRKIELFQGPWQLLLKLPKAICSITAALRGADGYVVRCPGTLALLSLPCLLISRKPIAVEVVGDPKAMFESGVGGRASRLLSIFYIAATKLLLRSASAVTYVTEDYLQSRYLAPPGAIVSAFSDVLLSDNDFAAAPRTAFPSQAGRPRLLFAGTMDQPYKGISTLLRALHLIRARGVPAELRIAGRGRLEDRVRQEIAHLGLAPSVILLGQLSRAELFGEMDACDLLVLPSRTEGLPRTVIEAMARATPIMASSVGGVPELLSEASLVPPDDAEALAEKIAYCLQDRNRLAAMSSDNLLAAARFSPASLEKKRRAFYDFFLRAAVQQKNSCATMAPCLET